VEQPNDIQEISKQLNEFGLPIKQQEYSYNDLLNTISYVINDLITHNFSALVQLLYRLDISEEQVRKSLKETTSELASNAIAKLIIERQQKKLELRKHFRNDPNIPDDERW
jgi:hypothetical protein